MVRLTHPDDDTELVVRRTYDAPVERVYEAWTNPEYLQMWLRPNEEIVSTVTADVQVGGQFRISYLVPGDPTAKTVEGLYQKIEPNKLLQFSWKWIDHPEFPEEDTQVTVEFRAQGDQTELVLTHVKFADRHMRDGHAWGWTGAVDLLAKHCRVVCRSIPDGQRPL